MNNNEKPCQDKLVFDSKKQALATALVTKYQRGEVNLKPYKCRHCGLWHLATNHD